MRLSDESNKKQDHNTDLRLKAQDYEKEIEILKIQRADIWREINRLKEHNDNKVREGAEQTDRLKALDYDLSRT